MLCPLTVGGSFEAKTAQPLGAAARGSRESVEARPASIAVDLATLDSGISLRNTHMRDNYLEVGKGEGFERAVLSDIVLEAARPRP